MQLLKFGIPDKSDRNEERAWMLSSALDGYGWISLFGFPGMGPRFEASELLEEGEVNVSDGAVTLLCDDQGCFAFTFFFGVVGFRVIFFAHEKSDQIGVLFDAAGFTKVTEARASLTFAGSRFWVSV
jgi:hypothetical protein